MRYKPEAKESVVIDSVFSFRHAEENKISSSKADIGRRSISKTLAYNDSYTEIVCSDNERQTTKKTGFNP